MIIIRFILGGYSCLRPLGLRKPIGDLFGFIVHKTLWPSVMANIVFKMKAIINFKPIWF